MFRVPANPNPSATWGGLQGTTNSDDVGGLNLSSSLPFDSNHRPYAFPPRAYSDVPTAGPLPSKDFRFGDSAPFRESPPGGAGLAEEEDDRMRNMVQTHRFSSFASDLSVESDATGTTATTATSSNGFSPLTNGPLSGMGGPMAPSAAYRARHTLGLGGLGPMFGGHNADLGLGSQISYGLGSGSVAGLPGLSAGPVHFPAKFDPDARRASWYVTAHVDDMSITPADVRCTPFTFDYSPAHFIDNLAHLNVNSGDPTSHSNSELAGDMTGGGSPFVRNGNGIIRRSPSGNGLGKSPLGMRIQVPPSFGGNGQVFPEMKEEAEPLTAVAGEYANIFNNYNGAVSQTSLHSHDGSRPGTGNPEANLRQSFHDRSLSHSLSPTGDVQSHDSGMSSDASLPIFMQTLTQEPAFDGNFGVYGGGSQPGSQTHLPMGDQQFDNHSANPFGHHGNYSGDFSFQLNDAAYQQSAADAAGLSQSYPSAQQGYTPYLHAPAPVAASSTSSLAGALQGNNLEGVSNGQW